MFSSRSRVALAGVAALSAFSVVAFARQFHGVGELDCAPVLEVGSTAAMNLTATGPNTGTVNISSFPIGVVDWSGTPSWDSNNKATVNVSISPYYTGLVIITAAANGQSASTSAATIVLPN